MFLHMFVYIGGILSGGVSSWTHTEERLRQYRAYTGWSKKTGPLYIFPNI